MKYTYDLQIVLEIKLFFQTQKFSIGTLFLILRNRDIRFSQQIKNLIKIEKYQFITKNGLKSNQRLFAQRRYRED